ncbi:MAG: hypothetical protein V1803_02995 [Candidatus Roizmanbacteria bacterium]
MNEPFKAKKIKEYPEFPGKILGGGIIFGLFGLITLMDNGYQRLVTLIKKLRSRPLNKNLSHKSIRR